MQFRKILMTGAVAGAAVLLAGGAWAADDAMANTYGNTVMTKSEKTGITGTLTFAKDGTYGATTTDADGKPVNYTGKWVTKDDGKTLCLTPNAPPDAKEAPKASCSPLEAHNVGDSWKVTTDQGETFDVTMTAGH